MSKTKNVTGLESKIIFLQEGKPEVANITGGKHILSLFRAQTLFTFLSNQIVNIKYFHR